MLHCIERRLMQVSWQRCEETAATPDHAPVHAAGEIVDQSAACLIALRTDTTTSDTRQS